MQDLGADAQALWAKETVVGHMPLSSHSSLHRRFVTRFRYGHDR